MRIFNFVISSMSYETNVNWNLHISASILAFKFARARAVSMFVCHHHYVVGAAAMRVVVAAGRGISNSE